MIYIFLIIVTVATMFITLGALTVKVSIMSLAIKGLTFLLGILGLMYVWQHISGRKS